MSDMISPVSPVSRIEPTQKVLGLIDLDSGLYQLTSRSLIALFQRAYPKDLPTLPINIPSNPLISPMEMIQPRNKYKMKKRKRYLKKDKKDFPKISSFFQKIVD